MVRASGVLPRISNGVQFREKVQSYPEITDILTLTPSEQRPVTIIDSEQQADSMAEQLLSALQSHGVESETLGSKNYVVRQFKRRFLFWKRLAGPSEIGFELHAPDSKQAFRIGADGRTESVLYSRSRELSSEVHQSLVDD